MSNRDDAADESGPIRVTIFDQPFNLRSPRGAEHVRQVARLLDERMRQVAAHLTTYDVAKVAMLTALNLADELQSVRAHYEQEESKEATPPQPERARAAQAEETERSPAKVEEQSWFDAIFDAPVSTKQVNQRMSTQVSARLQALRQNDNDAPEK